jgi:hypothetical protein
LDNLAKVYGQELIRRFAVNRWCLFFTPFEEGPRDEEVSASVGGGYDGVAGG